MRNTKFRRQYVRQAPVQPDLDPTGAPPSGEESGVRHWLFMPVSDVARHMANGMVNLAVRSFAGTHHRPDAEPIFTSGLPGALTPHTPREIQPSMALLTSRSLCGRRETNQDRAIAVQLQFGYDTSVFVIAVADGMGGYEGGALAATLAVTHFMAALVRMAVQCIQDGTTFDPTGWLRDAFAAANAAIQECAQARTELAEMGCTLTACIVTGATAHVASIGDSRACLCRDGRLEHLTRDDSLVQRMVDEGLISAEDAENHPLSNVITRSLGAQEKVDDLTVSRHALQPNDCLLLCSDGLWKAAEGAAAPVLDAFIHGAPDVKTLEHAAVELVDMAWRQGSDDNISIALMWYGKEYPCIFSRQTQRY